MSPVPPDILVIEDNPLNLKLFCDILAAQGYSVMSASHGMEGFRLARQHKPRLILLDIQLPEISGHEVAKWVREDADLRGTPVLAVTAFALAGRHENDQALTAVITKPISIKPFLEQVAALLGPLPA